MPWSWRVGRVLGIDIYIHYTFLILLGWIILARYFASRDLAATTAEVLFVLVLFLIVVLHEFGHALAARRYGIATRDITLLPIGGLARLERMPEDPKQELVVALAGPAVNVVLALICWAALELTKTPVSFGPFLTSSDHVLSKLLFVNIVLVVFNLLPAFPMDGGRVLRAFLAMRMDYVHATQVAASVGQGMALLFGFIGLLYNPLLVFVALFVWMGAAQESSMVQMRSALAGIPLSRAMITEYQTLSPSDSLRRAIEHILEGFQQDFPVVENDRVAGILTRARLLAALTQHGAETPVGEVMERNFATAEPNEMLENVFRRLQECECHTVIVQRFGRLVGIVTMENVGEFLMIQSALRAAHAQQAAVSAGV